jgi:hypothetical protein
LPALQSGGVATYAVTVVAPKGKSVKGNLTVHAANDAEFNGSTAVAIIASPKKRGAKATFYVTTLVRRFAADRRLNGLAAGGFELIVTTQGGLVETPVELSTSCKDLADYDSEFEHGAAAHSGGAQAATLSALRPDRVQDSNPEEILDNVIPFAWAAQQCPGSAEGDDAGNT